MRGEQGLEVSRAGGLSGEEDGERGQWAAWEVVGGPGRWGWGARETSWERGGGGQSESLQVWVLQGLRLLNVKRSGAVGMVRAGVEDKVVGGGGVQGQGTGVTSVWSLQLPVIMSQEPDP